VGNQWNDLKVSTEQAYEGQSSLKFSVFHTQGGYVNAYLTTSADGSGLEATNWEDRQAAKDISGFEALRFFIKGDAITQATIDLIEVTDRNANPVELTDYVSGINNSSWQEVRIPLADLKAATSDFTQIREIWIRVNNSHPWDNFTFYIDNIGFVGGEQQDVGDRPWAQSDPNNNGEWNWSTTFGEGGSSIAGANQWGDLPFTSGEFSFHFTHNGSGTAGGNITSGYSAAGVEPNSQAERDAGKAVNANGALTFGMYFNPTTFIAPKIRLTDEAGHVSNSVSTTGHYLGCGRTGCSVFMPMAEFATPEFNFAKVVSVTPYIDSTHVAGDYTIRFGQFTFRASGTP
jgi:hypothetical protein